ncbi:MFS transporter [Myroides sp. DF42-4-2]|uniref:MFS transporter n=1 Tax=unclassified Myroides TaxID=2642485 RepID=UPI00257579C1|nr:MFS transporter [Myroides sp. DF42-4-2]MDM1407581.1 MFS transporter [Myroides sp. DF42-4-2]
MNSLPTKTNYPALYTLVTVFFFWGFFAAGNSIFIPFCKAFFNLDQFQSQLIDFSFYTAYYFGALLLFILSAWKKRDIVSNWGYKRSIVYGLLFSTVGAVAMIWAVQISVYAALLVGLFIVALGFSLQQIAANPFAISLGDPKTGTSRVSLGGGINSLGTTIGPLLMAYALYGSAKTLTDDQIQHLSLDSMTVLYGAVGGLFLLAALLFFFSKKIPAGRSQAEIKPAKKAIGLLVGMTILLVAVFIPVFGTYKSDAYLRVTTLQKQQEELTLSLKSESTSLDKANTAIELAKIKTEIKETLTPIENKRIYLLAGALVVIVGSICFAYFNSQKNKKGWGAMQYPQLLLGMLAIFAYVGVEVGIGSNLGELLKLEEFGALQSAEIAPYVSMYWGSLMIGRWAGAVSVFQLSRTKEILALILVPFAAYLVILLANFFAGNEIEHLYYYSLCVLIQVAFSFWSKNKSARTMVLFSLFGLLAMVVGLFSTGMLAIYAFLAGGLACSVLWPAIFNIAIMGLGKYTAQGSSFLIMMILGGGILPPIQGKLADMIGIHESYIVNAVCFGYLLLFGIIAKRVLHKQGIAIDEID